MFVIVGRTALNYHECKKGNTDLDVWITADTKFKISGDQKLDLCVMPNYIMELFSEEAMTTGYASLSDLLAIKMSHLTYDIFWKKHKQDYLFLKTVTNEYNWELYLALVEHWKKEFGNKDYLSLYRTKDSFFDDFVKKDYEHDYLHTLVARNGIPVYEKCLKDGQEVFIDKNKFDKLDFCDKIRMFQEEVAVIALERWVIPSIKKDGEIIPICVAYNRSLHKTVTALTKGWASEFIVKNLDQFLNPLYNEMLSALTVLNLKEKYMKTQITFEELKEIIQPRLDQYMADMGKQGWYDVDEVILDGFEDIGVKLVGQDGGGEGGAEDCYSVLEIDGVFYKVFYSYYSHHGYEFDYASVKVVTPKEKLVTVYE